ncbi:MAG: FAD-binding oxidoreductase [Marinicellaceae bacterium]
MPDRFQLTLISTTNLDNNTVHFKFRIENDETIELIAGQFLRLLFQQDSEEVFRSYSIANILKNNSDTIDEVELAVAWVESGLATVGLQNLSIGDTIEAMAPYGRFCLTDQMWKRYFLVATGTGVTPYRAMTSELFQRIDEGAEIYIVMGARNEKGLLYQSEFRENAKTDGYYYVSCLSREPMSNPSELDFNGHVHTYLKQIEFDPLHDVVYLCGNPAMVDDAFNLLKEKGLPVPQIRREKYVSPPVRKKKPVFNIK